MYFINVKLASVFSYYFQYVDNSYHNLGLHLCLYTVADCVWFVMGDISD
jgi:hypothetical protein